MQRKIIDFHTHPYLKDEDNICGYKNVLQLSENKKYLEEAGIVKICGSVISPSAPPTWETVQRLNDEALKIRELYPDFYVPGFHVHPKYVKESVREVERMTKLGVGLVGELVPYMYDWHYGDHGFEEILEAVAAYRLPVSFHTMPDEMDVVEGYLQRYPEVDFIAAHPGEKSQYLRHIRLLKEYDNYYLDLSGTGMFRFGMLRYGIDEAGAEKFLFGSDFPVCHPFMNIGGVENDYTLTETEKQAVFFDNAKRLLKL